MGDEGARSSGAGQAAADALVGDLEPLGSVSARKMFGGMPMSGAGTSRNGAT